MEKNTNAVNANTIPMPCFSVTGSLRKTDAKKMTIKGYKAVIVTTTDTFPFASAATKNNVPIIPAMPVSMANVTPLALNAGFPINNNRIRDIKITPIVS